MPKRGAISIETIIIIILALLTLVIVAAAFTGGMKQLWEKISGITSTIPTADVDTAKLTCQNYCKNDLAYAFYCQKFGGSLEGKTCEVSPISESCTGLAKPTC